MKPALTRMRVAVIGAGWAGLACAVRLVEAGAAVQVFEAARVPGGRARTVHGRLGAVDNGQHVLIGPYRQTFDLMQTLGVRREAVLRRLPLSLHHPGGLQMTVPAWPFGLGGLAAVITARGLDFRARLALLRLAPAARQMANSHTPDCVALDWLRRTGQPDALVEALWAPLCVAALNTDVQEASARVLARVLVDGLFAAGRDAGLELPCVPLGEVLAEPAVDWLRSHGADVHYGARVHALQPADGAWQLALGTAASESLTSEAPTVYPGARFDAVVIATAPQHVTALLRTGAAAGAPSGESESVCSALDAFEYRPITTVHVRYPQALQLEPPMHMLDGNPGEWLFDHGGGRLSVVTSARQDAQADAVVRQLAQRFPHWPPALASQLICEKRATFACTPDLVRPGHATGLPGVWLAGDYTAGPYPATLEGAVRSGVECARRIAAAAA